MWLTFRYLYFRIYRSGQVGKYYTIKSGDTLWDIAKLNGVTVEQIKRLNNSPYAR